MPAPLIHSCVDTRSVDRSFWLHLGASPAGGRAVPAPQEPLQLYSYKISTELSCPHPPSSSFYEICALLLFYNIMSYTYPAGQ